MKNLLILLVVVCTVNSVMAQKYMSSKSRVHFYSSAPVEDIEAVNSSSKSVIDLEDGAFAFSIPSNQFKFKKKLMQQHFNENYIESEKYPKSTFTGKVKDWSLLDGEKEIVASGDLTIHGVTRQVEISAKLNVQNDQLTVEGIFPIALEEYKVKIPKALFYNIADTVEVTVHFEYSPLAK